LHYTTNVTVFPDSGWWELWKHFKEVDIQLSIDGIGKRQEYIRHPSNWDDIVENVQKYLSFKDFNVQISVSHTVSAYNIFYLDEFFAWCYSIGLPRPWLGKVHNPVYMKPTVWDNTTKSIIIEHLQTSQYHDVHVWAKLISDTDDSIHFDKFKSTTAQHDAYRGLNFKETFPELANFL
jgi:MoaA/NifB/PqqE/SkfB family radical SAM enzyme